LVNIPGLDLNLREGEEKEKIASLIPIPEDLDKEMDAGTNSFIIFATKRGVVKRSTLANLKSIRVTGIVAVKIDRRKGDSLADVALIKPVQDGKRGIILSSKNGKAILFHEEELREMGRYAAGVRGMRLEKGDEIASIEAVDLNSEMTKEIKKVVTITEKGYGKRTRLDAYRESHRGGKGVISIRVSEKNGKVVCIKQVKNDDELMISTSDGMVTKISARSIPTQGRNTQGVRLMNVEAGERVVGVEVV